MSEEEHKDRLELELRRAINTTTPKFDAEAWRRTYRNEFDMLLARKSGKAQRVNILKLHRAFWLGIAAGIVAVGCGLVYRAWFYRTNVTPLPVQIKSPAQIVTMASLSSAFRRGGMPALDKQLDEAVRQLGPRPMSVPTARLLADLGS